MTSPPLKRYAFPLLPVRDRATTDVVELGSRWELPERLVDASTVICGRPPMRGVAQPGAALANALRRELFVRRCRRSGWRGLTCTAVQDLPPPPGPTLGPLRWLRDRLLGGVLVALSSDGAHESVLDAVGRAAGATHSPGGFHAPGDGSAVTRVIAGGEEKILRLAPAGDPADPANMADALEHLERAGLWLVPRLAGRGVTEGISWMTESVLPGARPLRVGPVLWEQVVAFCARLPPAGGPPQAAGHELEVVARSFPRHAALIDSVRTRLAPVLQTLPAIIRHGDLWAGNLLVQRDGLTGVIDWASWHPSGVPGTDLLHLFASERKRRSRGELGELWLEHIWADPAFGAVTRPYWRQLGIDPVPEVLDAIAVSWWAAWVAQSVTRHPGRAKQAKWVEGNVHCVVNALARSRDL